MNIELMVPKALELLDQLVTDALVSGKHRVGDWRTTPNDVHLLNHVRLWEFGKDKSEDHLLNLVCRGLFLLQLREEAKTK